MFTGIVDHVGQVIQATPNRDGLTLKVQSEFKDFAPGESISVDGVCLTVVSFESTQFVVELSPETLSLSIARSYRAGQRVNLERAMRMNDRFGGHWVTGHVDGCVHLKQCRALSEFQELEFEGVSQNHRSFITKKGSITLNGVSLTVNETTIEGFTVMLIPHTLERTNLSRLSVGDRLNVEFDWMTKVIVGEARSILGNFLNSGHFAKEKAM